MDRATAAQRIFLSSTCLDLVDLRSGLRESLEELGYQVWASESPDFPADFSLHPEDNSLRNVERADFLPELRKMPLVAGHQVVSARGVGAFQKFVVVRVARHLERSRGPDAAGMALDELQDLLAEAFADLQLRACEHFPIFVHNRFADVEPGRFGDRQQEDGTLEAVRFERCRNYNVGVDHQPERDHPRLRLAARAALISSSICRDVSLSVPLRRDSSPITRRTSGSGAARRT